ASSRARIPICVQNKTLPRKCRYGDLIPSHRVNFLYDLFIGGCFPSRPPRKPSPVPSKIAPPAAPIVPLAFPPAGGIPFKAYGSETWGFERTDQSGRGAQRELR